MNECNSVIHGVKSRAGWLTDNSSKIKFSYSNSRDKKNEQTYKIVEKTIIGTDSDETDTDPALYN